MPGKARPRQRKSRLRPVNHAPTLLESEQPSHDAVKNLAPEDTTTLPPPKTPPQSAGTSSTPNTSTETEHGTTTAPPKRAPPGRTSSDQQKLASLVYGSLRSLVGRYLLPPLYSLVYHYILVPAVAVPLMAFMTCYSAILLLYVKDDLRSSRILSLHFFYVCTSREGEV